MIPLHQVVPAEPVLRAFISARNADTAYTLPSLSRHLYDLQRGHPPAPGGFGRNSRSRWRPFSAYRAPIDTLRPICGARLRTSAARVSYDADAYGPWRGTCPECRAIESVTTAQLQATISADPWYTTPYHTRDTLIDPVSGL